MCCGRDGIRRTYLSSPASSEVVSGRSEEGAERGRGKGGSKRRGEGKVGGGRRKGGRGQSCEAHMKQLFQILLS